MLQPLQVSVGGDPEIFLERAGKIVGSEKVLPKEGLRDSVTAFYYPARVVRDGVQVELNPTSSSTISGFGGQISACFKLLRDHLRTLPDFKISWKGVVEVEREELDSLTPESRILGCAPSFNIWGLKPISVDAATYRTRSAGGHFHFGLYGMVRSIYHPVAGSWVDNRKNAIAPLDILVGTLCVLLDRDPKAAIRRENYGRAGEYRLPPHGVEYRTPSNFWLKNYSLMSLLLGMANFALAVVDDTLKGGMIEQELIEVVDVPNLISAINLNDFDQALKNFHLYRPFMMKHMGAGFPLNAGNMDKFEDFVQGVRVYGLERYFPSDPITHWCDETKVDFETFLKGV